MYAVGQLENLEAIQGNLTIYCSSTNRGTDRYSTHLSDCNFFTRMLYKNTCSYIDNLLLVNYAIIYITST